MFSATCVKFYTRVLVAKRQKGVTMIEYALIASIIAVGLIATLGLAREQLIATWGAITSALTPAAAS
jgi:pilus assembly protein Flp/PilA